MNIKELREKDDKGLHEELIALRKQAFNLRMQRFGDQSARPSEIRQTRKDIARVKTIMTERKRASS